MSRTVCFTVLTSILVILVSGCSVPERSRALGNPAISGTTLALQVCANCHGVQGVSTSPNFPHLAAQSASYLNAQLKSYRSHRRADPAGYEYMWGISARLTDAQIDDLATYFSSQRPPAGKPGKPLLVKTGQRIYDDGITASNTPACVGCHGSNGEGVGQFPRLSGQHADYILKQLMVFQRTDERPEGSVMKMVAHGLTAENMASVAAYIEALPTQH